MNQKLKLVIYQNADTVINAFTIKKIFLSILIVVKNIKNL